MAIRVARVLQCLTTYGQLLLVALANMGKVELADLLLETAGKTGVHAATTREHNMVVELGTSIDVGILDGLEEKTGHAGGIDINARWLEQSLGRLETLGADLDHATIGKLAACQRQRLVSVTDRKATLSNPTSTTNDTRRVLFQAC
jgi:hypothetical protein